MSSTLVIPVRSFENGKTRLGTNLEDSKRRNLIKSCFDGIVNAGNQSQEIVKIVVISHDAEVLEYGERLGISSFCSELPLNRSLEQYCLDNKYFSLIIALGDLPKLNSFTPIFKELESVDVVIATDRHRKGTNSLAFNAKNKIRFSFGEDSYGQHLSQCINSRYSCSTLTDPGFVFDLDTKRDLNYL